MSAARRRPGPVDPRREPEYAVLSASLPRDVEALLVLVILPVAVGAIAEAALRDARRASFVAAVATVLVLVVAVQALDRNESWSWVAAVLVSPLQIALAVATVAFWHGRDHSRRHRH